MVPYKHTIGIERNNLSKSDCLGIDFNPSNQKTKFNPLLYECDIHKLKIIKDAIDIKMIRNNELQRLFHEVIKNGYLCDLLKEKNTSNQNIRANFKKQINYNEKNPNELIYCIMMIFINKWDIHFNYMKFVQFYCIV
ncbi:hypothetical protein RFI_39303, partial [Reticulomyxa filosa]